MLAKLQNGIDNAPYYKVVFYLLGKEIDFGQK
jgi:hypothetical protein